MVVTLDAMTGISARHGARCNGDVSQFSNRREEAFRLGPEGLASFQRSDQTPIVLTLNQEDRTAAEAWLGLSGHSSKLPILRLPLVEDTYVQLKPRDVASFGIGNSRHVQLRSGLIGIRVRAGVQALCERGRRSSKATSGSATLL